MKPVFKCDYCDHIGTKEDVEEHELSCINNYDRRSCYTCQHRGKMSMVDGLVKYECSKEVNIPAGRIFEFCKLYERKEKSDNPFSRFMPDIFGGLNGKF